MGDVTSAALELLGSFRHAIGGNDVSNDGVLSPDLNVSKAHHTMQKTHDDAYETTEHDAREDSLKDLEEQV